jgi:hypothetical protein
VSYLELADLLIRLGSQPERDLEELWQRIAFFVCVSNTDDHLRNHGFLLEPNGWALSPAYDVNPNPLGAGLKLSISETDNTQDRDLVQEVAPYFRVDDERAREIIAEVVAAVSRWKVVARKVGLSRSAQEQMAPAFEAVSWPGTKGQKWSAQRVASWRTSNHSTLTDAKARLETSAQCQCKKPIPTPLILSGALSRDVRIYREFL